MVVVARAHILDQQMRIEFLCLVIQMLNPLVRGHAVTGLLAIMIDAPGFIKEHHSDDARMVVVAVEHALQSIFIHLAAGSLAAIALCIHVSSVRHILPYKHAETVGPEILERIFNLEVFTDHVKATIAHCFDVVFQCFLAGSGINSLFPEALIQQAGKEHRLVVDIDVLIVSAVILFSADLALAKIRSHVVQLCVAVKETNGTFIEVRGIKIPQFLVCNRNWVQRNFIFTGLQCDLLCTAKCGASFNIFALFVVPKNALKVISDCDCLVCVALNFQIELNGRVVNIRICMRIIHIGTAPAFQIDGLPDATGMCIAAWSVMSLLANQRRILILAIRGLIIHHQGDLVVAGLYIIGNVELKWGITALMVANLLSIYIQGTEPVDRSKLQKYLLAIGNPGIVQVEVTLIPCSTEVRTVLDAARRGLPRERDIDLQFIILGLEPLLVLAHLIGVKFKVPYAVEVHPLVALPIRTGMFAAGDLAAGGGSNHDIGICILDVHVLAQLNLIGSGFQGLRNIDYQLGIADRDNVHDSLRLQRGPTQRHQFCGNPLREIRTSESDCTT